MTNCAFRHPVRRRGSTALLAMLFLVLFAALAIGFTTSATMSVQVAGNEQRTSRALLASESGMQVMKYHLATLGIPSSTPPDQLFGKVYESLAAKLNYFANMPANARTIELAESGTLIRIPKAGGWVSLDTDGSAFRAEVRKMAAGEKIEVKVFGRYGNTSAAGADRAIKLEYANFPNPAAIFNYGVASKSAITFDSNARIVGALDSTQGSVLSATRSTSTPITMKGNASISGDISLVNPSGSVSTSSNASIAGSNDRRIYEEHIHIGVEEPEFPSIDTSAFRQYAGNAAYGGVTVGPPPPGGETKFATGTMRNVYIRSNPGTGWVVFDSNMKVEGVIYIETPNKVRFDSNVDIKGVIVVQNNPTGTTANNQIVFNSNTKLSSLDSLPESPYYPPAMKALKGAAILAPNFYVHFNSNFGSVGGSIIADKMEFDSNAKGTVRGSLINLADTSLHFDSNAVIVVESQGTSNYPAGVKFGSRFLPLPDTYQEVPQ
jgi:hypothetical protein